MAVADEHQDYVWRFKLSDDDAECVHADALTEMVRRELRALLGSVVLTHRGQDLKVTGFRFLGEPSEEYAIYPRQAPRSPQESGPRPAGDEDPGS